MWDYFTDVLELPRNSIFAATPYGPDITNRLNYYANQGWELASMVPSDFGGYTHHLIMVFRRPRPEGAPPVQASSPPATPRHP